MSEPGAIYKAIPAIMADVGAVGKTRENKAQGYQFRGIDEVYEAVQLVMAKHGVCVIPSVVDMKREERVAKSGGAMFSVCLTIDHTFYASDGSHVVARTVGEAMDSGDKASNKAMSAAMKYALIESLCIPTREPKDTENEDHEVRPAETSPPPVGATSDQRRRLVDTAESYSRKVDGDMPPDARALRIVEIICNASATVKDGKTIRARDTDHLFKSGPWTGATTRKLEEALRES